MFKRFVTAITLIVLLFNTKVCALERGDLSAECAVLMNAQTGDVIFEKNADRKRSMASTTKIMTSLLAVESGLLQNEIVVTEDMVKVEGTSMGLLAGDRVSLDELLHGMLLQSGNDAANAAAVYIGDSVEEFVKLMNFRADEIGMKNTSFQTPSGLDGPDHYSTAYDMALLGVEAVKNPRFLSVCSKTNATLTYGNPPYSRTLYNHNKLLRRYDYVYGIKTGFTKKSGRCLVSYALKNGTGLVAVTLNAPNDWDDHKKLYDYGFEKHKSELIKPDLPDSISIVGASDLKIPIKSDSFTYSSSSGNYEISYRIYLPPFVYAPVQKGDVIGRWDVFIDGVKADSISIIADDTIK